MQDRQDRAVVFRADELVELPGGGHRARLGLAVAHHAGDDQLGIIQHRSQRVGEAVAQLAAFVDGTRRLRGHVA